MPNTDILDANGLQTMSFADIRDNLVDEMRTIYGSDINIASNSPDGQMINIYAQAGTDYRELATSIYNSFNPDTAIGDLLDQRCAINNIQRQVGTFTIQPITLGITTTVTLQGLDANYNNINATGYTVQDNNNTQYILINSITISPANSVVTLGSITPGIGYTDGEYPNVSLFVSSGTPNIAGFPVVADIIVDSGAVTSVNIVSGGGGRGCDVTSILSANSVDIGGTGGGFSVPVATVTLAYTYPLLFRASLIGAVQSAIETITLPVTLNNGVTSIINEAGPLAIGVNEETDAQFRVRRQRSTSISASGYLNSLQGKLLGLTGVTQAKVYENDEATEVNTIPANSIWCIVLGGSTADIGNTIYATKSGGCGMKGAIVYPITTPAGQTFIAKFDNPIAIPLYIKFNLKVLIANFTANITAIKNYIVNNITYTIGDPAYTTNITTIAQAGVDTNGGGAVVLDVLISTDNTNWYDYISSSTLQDQFVLSTDKITITVE